MTKTARFGPAEIVLLGLSVTVPAVFANTIRVPADFAAIQDAIDAAVAGDTVLVSPGTYVESLAVDATITITGVAPGDSMTVANTIVDAQGSGAVVEIGPAQAGWPLLAGLTLTGGSGHVMRRGPNGHASTVGGGVYLAPGADPTLRSCVISNNQASGVFPRGGGVFCDGGASLTIESSDINDNLALGGQRETNYPASGGGIHSRNSSTFTAISCRILRNEARGWGSRGGGVRCEPPPGGVDPPLLQDCLIADNRAGGKGGGLHSRASGVELLRTKISGNTATQGGGIWFKACDGLLDQCEVAANWSDQYAAGIGIDKASPTLRYTLIADNHVLQSIPTNEETRGAGIHVLPGSAPEILACTLVRNSAGRWGGGMYIGPGATPWIDRCTIAYNAAGESGAGILVAEDSSPTIRSSIVWANRPDAIGVRGVGAPNVIFCDIEGGFHGPGNFDFDPEFCATACIPRELTLAESSPCAGAGIGGEDVGAHGIGCDDPLEHEPRVYRIPLEVGSLEAAVQLACDRDTIRIEPGTYATSGVALGGRAIRIESIDPHHLDVVSSTVLAGDLGETVLDFFYGEDTSTVIAGLTIGEGKQGIRCRAASGPRIEYSRIIGNGGALYGGGVYAAFSTAQLADCLIADNESFYRGGGIFISNRSVQISDCRVAGNRAGGRGGGLAIWSAPVVVDGSEFLHNDAPEGGGIHQWGGALRLAQSTILGNTASAGGGGLYADQPGSVEISASRFAENSSDLGGGAFLNLGTGEIVNTIFDNNRASSGGGVYLRRRYDWTLRNCTIVANQADQGAGILSDMGSGYRSYICACIVWDNVGPDVTIRDSDPEIYYSLIDGGWPGEGNIDIDPHLVSLGGLDFVPTPWKYWDGDTYHPRSPCVDAGDPEQLDTFFDRHPRWSFPFVNGPRSDIGAYGGEQNIDWLR